MILDNEQRAAVLADLRKNTGGDAAQCNEALDLAIHAVDTAIDNLLKITDRGSEIGVVIVAKTLAVQMVAQHMTYVSENMLEKVQSLGIKVTRT